MSRSYKKHPVFKTSGMSGLGGKRRANRSVRHSEAVPSGKSNSYRKMYESWEVHDFRFYQPQKDAMDELWKKVFRRK